MTTVDIGEVTVDGKDIEVVTKCVFVGALITKDGLCKKEVRRRIAMGKTAMGGLTWDEGETSESFGVPDCSIRSGDLDDAKTWEKEDRRFPVVVLEKSTESIVDEEIDKHIDHREHQTGVDTGVKSDKGC